MFVWIVVVCLVNVNSICVYISSNWYFFFWLLLLLLNSPPTTGQPFSIQENKKKVSVPALHLGLVLSVEKHATRITTDSKESARKSMPNYLIVGCVYIYKDFFSFLHFVIYIKLDNVKRSCIWWREGKIWSEMFLCFFPFTIAQIDCIYGCRFFVGWVRLEGGWLRRS